MPDTTVVNCETGEVTIVDVPIEELYPDGVPTSDPVDDEMNRQLAARNAVANHPLLSVTVTEAQDWIETNVADLASAKIALKEIVASMVILRRVVQQVATDNEG